MNHPSFKELTPRLVSVYGKVKNVATTLDDSESYVVKGCDCDDCECWNV